MIDFLDAPLSENTGHNEGLAFDIAMKALEGLMRCPRLKAITITELNPDHGEDDMSTARIFVQAFAYALRAALSPEPI